MATSPFGRECPWEGCAAKITRAIGDVDADEFTVRCSGELLEREAEQWNGEELKTVTIQDVVPGSDHVSLASRDKTGRLTLKCG